MESVAMSVVYLGMVLLILYTLHLHLHLDVDIDGNQNVNVKVSPRPLSFRSHDGTFKILQVADLHFGNGPLTRCRDFNYNHSSDFTRCSDLNSTLFLRRLIHHEKPDFIAFTGDNIFGPSAADAAHSLLSAFAPAIDSAIPWAAVLGNHDHESTMDTHELIFFISLLHHSLSRPSHHPHIHGVSNFDLRVLGPPGSPLANTSLLDLLFLDSGNTETTPSGLRTYSWIRDSQLRWVSQTLSQNQSSSSALVFFHIPIPEMRELYGKKIVGQFEEGVACSRVNSGVLRSLASTGGVKGVFVGHDHNNDFCGNLEGIWLCYGGGFGYHAYGKRGWPKRARLILARLAKGDNHWTRLHSVETWKRLDDHNFTIIDHQLLWHP